MDKFAHIREKTCLHDEEVSVLNDVVEQRFKEAVADCLPPLLAVYLIRTRIECAAHLFDVGGLNKREFARELENIRTKLSELE